MTFEIGKGARRAITACLVATLLTGCGGGSGSTSGNIPPLSRPSLDPTYRPSGHGATGDVFVHLFEWPWTSIAAECESQLGPAGFKAVQVSPPQEDIVGQAWWTRYQPVSYSIELSRSGTRAEFVDMVSRCKTVGVDIYVDVVVNHMTGGAGTRRDGTVYSKYSYPSLYSQADFHSACSINSYQDAIQVQDCELLGMADLNTSNAAVQDKIAGYLSGLVQIGVAGFRLDAAKHIQPAELNAILAKVNQSAQAAGKSPPYFFAEVIDNGGEAVKARDYFGLGYSSGGAADITEFKFRGVGDKFLGTGGQRLSQLNPNGFSGSQFSEAAWNLMPADKAVVFLENHDTQRSSGILYPISYRDPAAYRLANVWMLAQPYGYPSVMSSYFFDRTTQAGRDAGPPANAPGCSATLEAATSGLWVCEHRDPIIARMVAFRHAVTGTPVANWWDNGGNAIAFARTGKGFVVINREASELTRSFDTGLAIGTYCDVLAGGVSNVACLGHSAVVGADGKTTVTLSANSGLVLQAAVKLP
jgi:alpha-amylase